MCDLILFIISCILFMLFLSLIIKSFLLKNLKIDGVAYKSVIVTGCDSGFGRILARLLDKQGARTIACCLTEKGAKSVDGETSARTTTIVLDITCRASIDKAEDAVVKTLKGGELWGLVNNAGVMPSFAPIEWTPMEEFEMTCEVNLLGTISVTKVFLPLVRRAKGRIINVCSVTSNCAYPGITNYVVSKAALKSFSICLRREIYGTGVTVHTIEPGAFRTGLAGEEKIRTAFFDGYKRADEDTRAVYGGHIATYTLKLLQASSIFFDNDIEAVPRNIIHALFARYPKKHYLVGYDANMFFRFVALLPSFAADYILGWPRPYGPRNQVLSELDSL